MPDLNTEGQREVTLRFSARDALIWSTVVAGALWADLVAGVGSYGIYAQWVAHRMIHLAPTVTFSVGLSGPLFLLFFTVATAWITLTFVGAKSQSPSEAWASHRTLAVAMVLVAGVLFLVSVSSSLEMTGRFLSAPVLMSLLISLLLIADGIVTAVWTLRFYQRTRV